MKIILTGATGFLGRQLVPILERSDHQILLAGRDLEKLAMQFPDASHCHYDDLEVNATGCDLLIHLAVLNNSSKEGLNQFRKVNVVFFRSVINAATKAGVKRLVNVTSFHALEENPKSPYAQSKREALEMTQDVDGLSIINLFLPAVHGADYAGKLSVLNRFPRPIQKALFPCVAALAPTIDVRRIADFIDHDIMSSTLTEPVLLYDPKTENVMFRFSKRMLDLSFALAVAALFWWGLLIIWVWVKIDSPGGGIFSQDRVGRDGKLFSCLKFRTMKQGTVQAGTHEVPASSVTKIGAFLRKTKIDELPQIWNIFRGELSLVGPRPCLPVQTELIEARQRRGVDKVVPGITGLAQINGIDMSNAERLANWDARYIAQQSLLLDAKIVVATLTGSGQGDLVAAT